MPTRHAWNDNNYEGKPTDKSNAETAEILYFDDNGELTGTEWIKLKQK